MARLRYPLILIALVGAVAGCSARSSSDLSPVSKSNVSALYFFDGPYLSRIVVGSAVRKERVFRFPAYAAAVTAYTIGDGLIFWTAQMKDGHSALFGRPLSGGRITRIVSELFFPMTVVVAGSHVYWIDLNATGPARIGRSNLDGSEVQRRFIVQPHLSLADFQDGNDFDGLTTDGRYLYFTRCMSGEIGRVGLDGHGLNNAYIVLPGEECPQAISYANGNLYFTDDESIGRVGVDGSNPLPHWLNVSADTVAAGAAGVFWAIGNANAGLIGRASLTGRIVNPRFIYPTGAGEEIVVS